MVNRKSTNIFQKRRDKPLIVAHHISSFGILNRNGLDLASKMTDPEPEPEPTILSGEFTNWSMPEERPGYMQTRRHDFL